MTTNEEQLFQKEMQASIKAMPGFLIEHCKQVNQKSINQSLRLQDLIRRSDEALNHAQELMKPKQES